MYRSASMARHERNPHFFRVILPQVIQNGTLELPRNFVKEQGKHLSMYARLRVPTGSESKVELKRCNGRAWLGKGWSDFAHKYSIKCAYFLVFKYEGGSRFSVQIFDLSTSEIEYPVSTARATDKRARECKFKEEYSHGNGDEISDGFEVKLQRPGSFRICMTRYYISPKPKVHIPKAHFRRYIKGNEHGGNIIVLHGSDGKTWPVKYSFSSSTLRSIQRKASFTLGWKEFAKDNRLRVGDICNFEMIICKPKAYKVTISRSTS